MDTSEIGVSVIVNAYNHEKYISECLDGILMQKTVFSIEVLIHDDASTDKTADIIREYEREYPDKLKPIYQSKNQYSQNVSIGRAFQYPRVKGKYVAMCEGDDLWTDENKLQKQYDLMEKHPEVDICAHASAVIDAGTSEKIAVRKLENTVKIIKTGDVIRGGGAFVDTASLFYRAELLSDFPKFRQLLNLDYCAQVHGSLRGGMLYIPDEMCIYRAHVADSWTSKMKKDRAGKIRHLKLMRQVFKQMDEDTNHRYRRIILSKRVKNEAKILLLKAGVAR